MRGSKQDAKENDPNYKKAKVREANKDYMVAVDNVWQQGGKQKGLMAFSVEHPITALGPNQEKQFVDVECKVTGEKRRRCVVVEPDPEQPGHLRRRLFEDVRQWINSG